MEDGLYLSGNDKKTQAGINDPEECKKICEEAKSFFCRSFDYNVNSRYCYFQVADRHTHMLATGNGWKYFERDCEGWFIDNLVL